MPSKKSKAKETKSPLDREKVQRLISEIRQELLDCEEDIDLDTFDKLEAVETDIFGEFYKKRVRFLQTAIAKKLRAAKGNSMPQFTRVRFYIWTLENIPEARQILPLIDHLEWCPDSIMSQVENHYQEPKFDYYAINN